MTNKGKKVIDARENSDKKITHVLVKGNERFTPVKRAIPQAERGEIDLVVVHPKKGDPHLRTRPDKKVKNNLDEMAKK